MAQPGHATDIYTNYRYVGQDTNTTYPPNEDRPGDGAYFVATADLLAASGVYTVPAPCAGKIVRIEVVSGTVTDATDKITLAITNESNSSAAIASAAYDDDPVLAVNTATALTLSTTAANLAVDQGDNIEVDYTEAGTIVSAGVTFWFENF